MTDAEHYEAIERLAANPATVKDATILWLMVQLRHARGQLIAVEMALKSRLNFDRSA